MCACVSTSRRTGRSSRSTACTNGSHCERTISESTTVMPSSSTMTPALLTPDSPPGCSQTNTPSASSYSVSVGTVVTPSTLVGTDRGQPVGADAEKPLDLELLVVADHPVDRAQRHVR